MYDIFMMDNASYGNYSWDEDEINTETIIFKKFIDDIIYIRKHENNSDNINNRLTEEFKKYNLELTFRQINTTGENNYVEFLDVCHVSDQNAKRKFIIKDFVKPTAIDSTFLNGGSFHPPHVYKGIIVGEGIRLRRLNETDVGYQKSITRLKEKCIKSGFKNFIIEDAFKIIENYENIWNKNEINYTNNHVEEKRILKTRCYLGLQA